MEFRFQPDLFQRGDTSVQAGPISIQIRCPAATNCQPGSPRGRINNPERVRKGGRYPRAPEAALASAPPAVSEAYAAMESGNATFCAQRYRSYDPASGTFLGCDGRRHRCE